MSDTVQFSVVSDPDKWEPVESFQCASQEDAIKAAALFKELHGVIERQAARIKELEKDAERYRSLIDATEINADSFYWSRNEKAKSATIVAEMDAIFGMTEE